MTRAQDENVGRRPRFKRSHPPPLRLTADDVAILQHVAEHRFLRSTHVAQLLQRSHDKISRRLAALYHNGFLDRPRAQIEFFTRAGSAPMIYALGNKAVGDTSGIDWTDKNRTVQRPYIEHTLLIADFMVRLECALRGNSTARLLRAVEVAPGVRSWTMTARTADDECEIAVTPDKVFGIEFLGTGRRNVFLLEADRATMPVERSSLAQSSMKKKFLAYHHGHNAKRHVESWGVPGFRVLTLTKSTERLALMIEVVKAITNGKGSNVFLFADSTMLRDSNPLAATWISGKGERVELLGPQ